MKISKFKKSEGEMKFYNSSGKEVKLKFIVSSFNKEIKFSFENEEDVTEFMEDILKNNDSKYYPLYYPYWMSGRTLGTGGTTFTNFNPKDIPVTNVTNADVPSIHEFEVTSEAEDNVNSDISARNEIDPYWIDNSIYKE